MTLKPTIIISIMLLSLSSVSFPAEDVHDYVLKAYRISPAQEAQFARDQQMSPFWAEWDSANKGGTVAMDYIDMVPELNGWVDGANTFSDSTDAQLLVKAAYGIQGLYLQFVVIDNSYQPPAGYESGSDLDIQIDPNSSEYIRNADSSIFIEPAWGWTLTYATIQYQVAAGSPGGALPSYMMINFYSNTALMYNRINLTQLPTDYAGWDLDSRRTISSQDPRFLEWRIPWNWVGCNGGLASIPSPGKMIAMAGGYNDYDSPTQTGRKSLRWKERDPFNICPDLHPADSLCDAWGDILITDRNVGVQSNPSHATPRSISVSHPIKKQLTRNNTISPCIVSDKNGMRSYWDLAGRRWNAKR